MGLLERIEKTKTVDTEERQPDQTPLPKKAHVDEYRGIKEKAHQEIIETINRKINEKGRTDLLSKKDSNNEQIFTLIGEALEVHASSVSRTERNRIAGELFDDVMGYGPLEVLLKDEQVTEIMVNGPDRIYVERDGRISLSDICFRDQEHIMNVIDRIVSSIGRHVDEASPMVDARLSDGSRVNIIIPPLSLVGPVITIRKFFRKPLTDQDLVRYGSVTRKMLSFLEACVRGKLNIIVSGGTGSGKTTLLNVLSSYIPENERIITIEDAAELRLNQCHVVTLESRPPNLEGKGQVAIRDLVKNSLRMRPDRIIVGEVRSGETLDMLQAMNTGHDGSITTAHANNPRDLLSRLETMVLMAGMELPVKAIREQISSAIDLIVQQSRMRDGTRKITKITEISGMEGDTITLQDLYEYETDGQQDQSGYFKGRFHATGVRPLFLDKLKNNGIGLNDDWFRD
jgi:pilus assembly protein CpaF